MTSSNPYRKGQKTLIIGDLKKFKSFDQRVLNSKSDKTGLSLFHHYIINSKEAKIDSQEVIQTFIQGGVDINQLSDKEHGFYSALHFAVDYPASFELTKVLVENGIDITLKDENGNTAFWNACHNYRGDKEQRKIIEYLFNNWASTETPNKLGVSVTDLIKQLGKSIDEELNPNEWDLRKLKITKGETCDNP
ncbi:MAG: ankyrin repeat domain-containing protein [Bacteroidota bacterium]